MLAKKIRDRIFPMLFAAGWLLVTNPAEGQVLASNLRYFSITPCRVMDTTSFSYVGPFGPGPVVPAVTPGYPARYLALAGRCGLPATARAYAVNLTLVPSGSAPIGPTVTLGYAGQIGGAFSLANPDRRIIANNAIVPADSNGIIQMDTTGETNAILDVHGYFAADINLSGFTALSPCRLVDTRGADSYYTNAQPSLPPPINGPSIPANGEVSFNLGQVTRCGALPTIAQGLRAYVLNVTLVPKTANGVPIPVGFITIYPTGETRPVASLLNDLDARILANGGIFKAGSNGAVTVYSTDAADVLIDIHGYFRTIGGANYTTVKPCTSINSFYPSGTMTFRMDQPGCSVPQFANVQAVAANFTVTPRQPVGAYPFGYLSVWATGDSQPVASLLNALDGKVVGNASVVKVDASTQMNAFLSDQIQTLLISISGYFQ